MTGPDMRGYEAPGLYEVPNHDVPSSVAVQFASVGGETAFIAMQFATAHQDYLVAEAEYKRVRAKAYLMKREQSLASGTKLTENHLDALLDADDGVFAARMVFVTAEATRERWKGALEAIRAKRDSLVGLAASARAELQAWGAERVK